jgi:hypothetical protein
MSEQWDVFGLKDPLCHSSSSVFHFFPIIIFLSTTPLTGMTSISLHMQWPLTSQFSFTGQFSQREQLFFFVTDQTPRPHLFFQASEKEGCNNSTGNCSSTEPEDDGGVSDELLGDALVVAAQVIYQ